jgi:triosephosphate isomerase
MKDFLPVLFINFKTYGEATGRNAVSLAKKAERVAADANASIALVVQAADIRLVSSSVKLPVFAQHIDPVSLGSNTGHILPEAVKEAGAIGTVLNHAENKRDNVFLERAIARAKGLGLLVMVCAEDLQRAGQIASFENKPDFIAVEPPELIGGNVSVSTARPELITDSVRSVKDIAPKIEVITGAGVKNAADVRKAIELGTRGVFVASGIIKAGDQESAIKELVSGFGVV